MDEVAGILIALGGLFAGLVILAWACGDFNRSSRPSNSPGQSSDPST